MRLATKVINHIWLLNAISNLHWSGKVMHGLKNVNFEASNRLSAVRNHEGVSLGWLLSLKTPIKRCLRRLTHEIAGSA